MSCSAFDYCAKRNLFRFPHTASRDAATRRGRLRAGNGTSTVLRRDGLRRKGALLSLELIFALTVFAVLFFSMVEFSMLLATHTRLQMASRLGCRAGTLPAADAAQQEQAVRQAVAAALEKQHLIDAHQINFAPGQYVGDQVAVDVRLPMDVAAPNLLVPLGFNLSGRMLRARTVMRKE